MHSSPVARYQPIRLSKLGLRRAGSPKCLALVMCVQPRAASHSASSSEALHAAVSMQPLGLALRLG